MKDSVQNVLRVISITVYILALSVQGLFLIFSRLHVQLANMEDLNENFNYSVVSLGLFLINLYNKPIFLYLNANSNRKFVMPIN